METENTNITRIAEVIEEAMNAQGVSIRDLAKKAGVTYEHIRRIVRGAGIPAGPLLRVICDELDLDHKEMTKLASADSIEKKFGDVPALLADKEPGMAGIERAWKDLTEIQQEDLTKLARDWARRNRLSGGKS